MASSHQTHFSVCYHVRGTNLNPDRVNPLLRRFNQLLKDFKIEDEYHKVSVLTVDDSIFEQVDSSWIKCSTVVRVNVTDFNRQDSMWGLPHSYSAEIHRKLREFTLTDGKYSKRIDIEVKDTKEGQPGVKNFAIWPKELF